MLALFICAVQMLLVNSIGGTKTVHFSKDSVQKAMLYSLMFIQISWLLPLTGKESDLRIEEYYKIHDFCFFVYLINIYDSLDFHETNFCIILFSYLRGRGVLVWCGAAQGFEL